MSGIIPVGPGTQAISRAGRNAGESNPRKTIEETSRRNAGAEGNNDENFETLFPALKGKKLEVAGVFWFQGFSDQYACGPEEYESNMKHFIHDVRKEFGVPKLPFVIAVFGCNGSKPFKSKDALDVQKAQLAMNDVPEFKANVKAFRTDLLVDKEAERLYKGWRDHYAEWEKVGSDYGCHYLGSAIWYTRIGHAAGEAMKELMED